MMAAQAVPKRRVLPTIPTLPSYVAIPTLPSNVDSLVDSRRTFEMMRRASEWSRPRRGERDARGPPELIRWEPSRPAWMTREEEKRASRRIAEGQGQSVGMGRGRGRALPLIDLWTDGEVPRQFEDVETRRGTSPSDEDRQRRQSATGGIGSQEEAQGPSGDELSQKSVSSGDSRAEKGGAQQLSDTFQQMSLNDVQVVTPKRSLASPRGGGHQGLWV